MIPNIGSNAGLAAVRVFADRVANASAASEGSALTQSMTAAKALKNRIDVDKKFNDALVDLSA